MLPVSGTFGQARVISPVSTVSMIRKWHEKWQFNGSFVAVLWQFLA
jgi:hypothetical protein